MEDLKNIIKEEYEKKYRTQKYEDSVLKNTFEEVVIKAMTKVKLLNIAVIVGRSEQLNPMTEEMEIALESACKKVGKKSTNLKNRL